MTQLITRLSWNDPWSTPHHLAAKCVPPYLLLSSCCFHKQQLTFMHGTTHFILRLLNEDKHGASIVYRKWEPLTSTLEEDYDRKCTGHRSHISLLATLTHSTRLFANSLLFEEGGAPLFTLQLFSFGWERDFFMWWCWWNFVLCDLLHFEWRMITSYKSSLAASCHRIKTSTTATDRTIFQSCRNTTKRNRETTRPTWENYYSYIMNAPTSRILDLWTVERLHQICQR